MNYGENTNIVLSIVYRWFTKFSSGQESVKDAPYSGKLINAISLFNVNKIKCHDCK